VGSLDALLRFAGARRARWSVADAPMRRANRILDQLDGVKLALLGDEAGAPEALSGLAEAVRRPAFGDGRRRARRRPGRD
jgi:hypothetical protein